MSSLRQGGMYSFHREVRPCCVFSSAVSSKIPDILCRPLPVAQSKQSYRKVFALAILCCCLACLQLVPS